MTVNLTSWARVHFAAHRERKRWPFFWRITLESLALSVCVAVVLSAFFDDKGRPDLENLSPIELLYVTTVIGPVFETLLLQTIPIAIARALGARFRLQVAISATIFAALHFLDGMQAGICAGLVGGTYLAFTYARWREVSFATAFLMTVGIHAVSNGLVVAFLLTTDALTSVPNPPNKAPEPTPTAVTPRAIDMKSERSNWIVESNEARGAPAAVVAHL